MLRGHSRVDETKTGRDRELEFGFQVVNWYLYKQSQWIYMAFGRMPSQQRPYQAISWSLFLTLSHVLM